MAKGRKVGRVPGKKSTVKEPRTKNAKAPSERRSGGGRSSKGRGTVALPATTKEAYGAE